MNNKPVPAQSFPAGTFICDKCDARVYFSMVCLDPKQLSKAELDKLRGDVNVTELAGNAFFYTLPAKVECSGCKTEYQPFESQEDLYKILEET